MDSLPETPTAKNIPGVLHYECFQGSRGGPLSTHREPGSVCTNHSPAGASRKEVEGAPEVGRRLPDSEVNSGTHRTEGFVGEAQVNFPARRMGRPVSPGLPRGGVSVTLSSLKADLSVGVAVLSLFPGFWPGGSKGSREERPKP